MLSIPDMALLGAAALMFFGPEQLPKVARKAGMLIRDVQNTSQSFIREMERAADGYTPPNYTPPEYNTGEVSGTAASYDYAHDYTAPEYTPPHYEEPAPPPPDEPFHDEVSLRPSGPSEHPKTS
jgi:sec-independent protein translocase protein TatA